MGNNTLHNTKIHNNQSTARIESTDIDLGDDKEYLLGTSAETPDLIVVTDDGIGTPWIKQYADELKFNEEVVEFHIALSEDPQASQVIEGGCNGEMFRVERGMVTKLKRKLLASLIGRTHDISTKEYTDDEGLKGTKIVKKPITPYSVSITNDPSGTHAGSVGRRWFSYMQANG